MIPQSQESEQQAQLELHLDPVSRHSAVGSAVISGVGMEWMDGPSGTMEEGEKTGVGLIYGNFDIELFIIYSFHVFFLYTDAVVLFCSL